MKRVNKFPSIWTRSSGIIKCLPEKDSPDVEVGIFAIRKELIRNYLVHFTEQGIEPFIVQTSPMASYNAARFEQGTEPQKATVLLDMGAGNRFDCHGGQSHLVAANPDRRQSIHRGPRDGVQDLLPKGEKLKRSAATSKYARQVFQAMRPVFADLVSEVQRSVGYYTSTHREAQIARVIGMGNAFKLPGLQKFLNQNLQIEVERLSGFKKMTSAANLEVSPAFADNVSSLCRRLCGWRFREWGWRACSRISCRLRSTRRYCMQEAALVRGYGGVAGDRRGIALGGQHSGRRAKFRAALGNLQSISVYKVSNKDEAERIINGGGGDARWRRPRKWPGASDWFQSELSRADSSAPGTRDC